jgi:site-specific recombinase XerC
LAVLSRDERPLTYQILDELPASRGLQHLRGVLLASGALPARDENVLVFTTQLGGPLDAANVRRSFRRICVAAKIGENWTPRELRHSFVSTG